MQGRSLVFSNGGHYCECRRAVPFRRVWGYPPPEKFQIWRLQNAIFSTCHEICLQSTSNKCEKASVFSAYILLYFRGPVNLKHTIYPSTIAYTKHFKWFEIVHIQVNFKRGFCFLLLTICRHRGTTNFSAIEASYSCTKFRV